MVLAAAGAGTLVWSLLDVNKKDAEVTKYKDKDPSTMQQDMTPQEWIQNANNAVKKKNGAARRTNLIIAGFGAIWAGNIIDALILGGIHSKKVKKLYFSLMPVDEDNNLRVSITMDF
jgi:hypothetical protein